MTDRLCPFIGLPDDRSTTLEFPAQNNTCYKASPPERVNLKHQQFYCLTPGHQVCPVYQAQQPVALPPELAAPAEPSRLPIPARYLAIAAIALILLLAVGIPAVLAALRPDPSPLPVTGSSFQATLPPEGTSPVDLLLNQTSQAATAPARPNCPMPDGWTTYVVQPTDSLALLGILFQTSAEELRTANCLPADGLLQPGEVVYVPVVALPTTPPTPTPTAVPAWIIPTSPPSSNPPPPTTAPTTAPVVPTATPQPATPQPKPTKTQEVKPTKKPKPTHKARGSTAGSIWMTEIASSTGVSLAGIGSGNWIL